MTEQEKYLEGHRNCGIKVGYRVRVTRKAESYESGWGFMWAQHMDVFVGKELPVLEVFPEDGIICGSFQNAYIFPYFVLEKI